MENHSEKVNLLSELGRIHFGDVTADEKELSYCSNPIVENFTKFSKFAKKFSINDRYFK